MIERPTARECMECYVLNVRAPRPQDFPLSALNNPVCLSWFLLSVIKKYMGMKQMWDPLLFTVRV
jgi:hypothetical protein